MSEFSVEVVRIGPVTPLPNADTLSITKVHGGYPVIFRNGQFAPGALAVYVSVDAIVDGSEEPFAFLGGGRQRIKAKRLRGTFSMGILVAAPEGAKEGDDLREALRVDKWIPPEEREQPAQNGKLRGAPLPQAKAPPGLPIPEYDLAGLRRYSKALVEGEPVIITEKIHGENTRLVRTEDGVLHVGSRDKWKLEGTFGAWWPAVRAHGLDVRMEAMPVDHVVYGEVYGQMADLPYGHRETQPRTFRAFDVYDRKAGKWLDHADASALLRGANIDLVPVLYQGPWQPELTALAEGRSVLANHLREGLVVRPMAERNVIDVRPSDGATFVGGRAVFKLIGEGFLTRKEKAE